MIGQSVVAVDADDDGGATRAPRLGNDRTVGGQRSGELIGPLVGADQTADAVLAAGLEPRRQPGQPDGQNLRARRYRAGNPVRRAPGVR